MGTLPSHISPACILVLAIGSVSLADPAPQPTSPIDEQAVLDLFVAQLYTRTNPPQEYPEPPHFLEIPEDTSFFSSVFKRDPHFGLVSRFDPYWPPAPSISQREAARSTFAGAALIPTIKVTLDNTVIDSTCIIEIDPNLIIADADNNGVIHITAPDITVTFAPGSVLRGSDTAKSADANPPDAFTGTGIRIDNQENVIIKGAAIEGFKVGIHATGCNNLKISDSTLKNLYRQRLASTTAAEDQTDWLWPHSNDNQQWLTTYGAAVYIEDSKNIQLENNNVRTGQNGILLSRVGSSRIFDNDCSFLSGWGLGLWRSSDNTITRNALDFNIRGYSHGIYNRGQDSAGLLMFEQSSRNLVAENSITHGGDGVFAFAGKEALGETGAIEIPRAGVGCNDNIFYRNDLSYAAAHGLELTFSFNNRISGNRMIGNGICGIWGGYSQRTVIDENIIEDNGAPGPGEGGGINIEHGAANSFIANRFARNSKAIGLWAKPNAGLAKLPWHAANHRGSIDNVLVNNRFDADTRAVVIRDSMATFATGNTRAGDGEIFTTDAADQIRSVQPPANATIPPGPALPPDRKILGTHKPVGARPLHAGRHNIVMMTWGPWDHESPLLRPTTSDGWSNSYELFNPPEGCKLDLIRPDGITEQQVFASVTPPDKDGDPVKISIRSTVAGLWPYELKVSSPSFDHNVSGTLINASWDATFFPWTIDPRPDAAATANWRAEAAGPRAVKTTLPNLSLKFGYGGPSSVKISDSSGEASETSRRLAEAKLPSDRFGVLASTVLPLAPGKYKLSTLTDDGIRIKVTIGGGLGAQLAPPTTLIDRWDQHGPTRDEATFTVPAGEAHQTGLATRTPVQIEVEYFEIDGYAVLDLSLSPADVNLPVPSVPAPANP